LQKRRRVEQNCRVARPAAFNRDAAVNEVSLNL
jgi:hypothetical protein